MAFGRDDSVTVPSCAEVLRTPVFLPVFAVATLSTWGDYIARITVAAVVFSWTGSALATAATFAVSLVPSVLGRALLSPLVRPDAATALPRRQSHVIRAAPGGRARRSSSARPGPCALVHGAGRPSSSSSVAPP